MDTVAAAVGIVGKKAGVRSESMTWSGGILTGLLASYTQWAFWFYAATDWKMMLLIDPESLWQGLQIALESGVWTIFEWQPTGWALAIFWIVEVLVILFGSLTAIVGKLGQSENIYCETCKRWGEEVFNSLPLKMVEDGEALKKELEAGNFTALEALYPSSDEPEIDLTEPGAAFTRLLIMACKQCDRLHVLDVLAVSVDEDGDESEELIVDNLLIDSGRTNAMMKRLLHP